MSKLVYRLFPATALFAAGCGFALAASSLEATVTLAPASAPSAGRISARDLAKQAAKTPFQPGRPAEMPRHLRPDGTSTAAPKSSSLSLPTLPQTVSGVAAAPAPMGFAGIASASNSQVGNPQFEPPDQGLAVNNNVVAEINNEIVQFCNLSSNTTSGPIGLPQFFQSSNSCGDPQVFFDPSVQRWFFMEIASSSCTMGSLAIEGFDIAVSASADSLGSYSIYHVRAFSSDLAGCGGWDCLPDYPKAGYDANGFYISVNLWNLKNNRFIAAATYVLPKSQLVNGASVSAVRVLYPGDFAVQPSVPAPGQAFVTAAGGVEYLMEARNIWDGSSKIRVWAISNTASLNGSKPSLKGYGVDVAGEAYGATVPSTEPSAVGPYCASVGVTSAPSLDAGYQSFQSTVQMANGQLFGVLPFGTKDTAGLARDSLAWFAITPSVSASGAPAVSGLSQGYVVPPDGYSLSYPAFALNAAGAGILGFSVTNKNSAAVGGFPSAGYVAFSGGAVSGGIVVTGQGGATDDGFSGCRSAGAGGVGRWGDYGAAAVDAATGVFYAANEYIPGWTGARANWGTFISQATPAALSTTTASK